MPKSGPSACAAACCRPAPCARIAHGAISLLPGFTEGAWWVQDAAAALPARLLGDVRGQEVADLCAAPGGKTAQLALAGAQVTAVDRSAARLDAAARESGAACSAAETVAADALEWQAGPFDAVLLDAPCSSTGTIRRHPDVPWLKTEADLARLTALQQRLLDRAVELLKPGGTLVYCVCSLEPEEGEQQIAALLARDPRVARKPDCGRRSVRPRRIRHRGRRPAHAAAASARSRPALGRARRLLRRPARSAKLA